MTQEEQFRELFGDKPDHPVESFRWKNQKAGWDAALRYAEAREQSALEKIKSADTVVQRYKDFEQTSLNCNDRENIEMGRFALIMAITDYESTIFSTHSYDCAGMGVRPLTMNCIHGVLRLSCPSCNPGL